MHCGRAHTRSQHAGLRERDERGAAAVQFADSAAAAAAAGAGVTSIGGCDVEVAARTPPKPREPRDVPASVNLYLKGLDEETTRDEVEETLGGFGEVTSVKLDVPDNVDNELRGGIGFQLM